MKKLFTNKLFILVIAVAAIVTAFPYENLLTWADNSSGGFELSLNWNDNDDRLNYVYDSTEPESKVVRLNVKYANKDMKDVFAKGTVAITVPGIGAAGRTQVIGASSVAADKADKAAKEYAWSYTYSASSDTYTFTNNNTLTPESHFAGSFEILWTLDSRITTHNYSSTLQAQLNAAGGIEVKSNEVTYKQTRHKDDYNLILDTPSRDYRGEGLTSQIDPEQYWWVNYRAISTLRHQSLGVYYSRYEVLLPEGAEICFAEGNWNGLYLYAVNYTKTNTTEIKNGTTYRLWQFDLSVHDEEHTSRILDFLVLYPKSQFPESQQTDIYVKTIGTYNDLEQGEEVLAEEQISAALGKYPFPSYTGEILYADKTGRGIGAGTEFARAHSEEAWQNGYIDGRHVRNGRQSYEFELTGGVIYPKLRNGEHDTYDLEMRDEKVEVLLADGTYKRLAAGEYEFERITLPRRSDVLNQNKQPISECEVEIYTQQGIDGAWQKLSGSYSIINSRQEIDLPAGTTGVKLIFLELQEGIEVKPVITLKLHTDDDKIVTDGGELYNTVSACFYSYNSLARMNELLGDEAEENEENDVPEESETEPETEAEENNAGTDEEESETESDTELEEEEPAGAVRATGPAVSQAPDNAYKSGDYDMPARLYILERPNFYYNTTTLDELEDYNIKESGLTSNASLRTTFSYLEEEELTAFQMYTILPKELELPNAIRDVDALYDVLGFQNDLGISEADLNKALTVKLERNYKNSGRIRITFSFDFSRKIAEPEGFIQVNFPVVVRGDNLFRYGADVTLRSVSVVQDNERIVQPSYGVAFDDGSYAFVGEENIWSDINADGVTDELLSQSMNRQMKTSTAIAIEEGITKLVATEIEGGIFTVPSRIKDESDNLQYVEDEIPLAETGSEYSYKLRMNPISDKDMSYATDIVFVDALETGEMAQWQGTFIAVDASEAENLLSIENGTEVKAEIYYSSDDFSAEMDSSSYQPDLEDSRWSKTKPAVVKTIAVSFGDAKLAGDQQLAVTVTMQAPADPLLNGKITENKTSVYYNAMSSDGQQLHSEWLPSNPVPVKLMPPMVNLRIRKIAKNSDEVLEGALFDLYEYPESGSPDPDTDTLIREDLKTNSRGEVLIRNLPGGIYYLIEKQAPKGYQLKTDPIKVDLTDTSDAEVVFTIENEQKPGEITLVKKNDRNHSLLVPGAVFDLYQKDGDTYVKIKDGIIVQSNGKIELTDLEWGDYYFIETASPAGYKDPDPDKKYEFTINAENDAGAEITLEVFNEQEPAEIRLIKYEKLEDGTATTTPLANAFYILYAEDGTELGTYKTDDDGAVILDDMAFGKYYFLESIAPKGYYLHEDKIEFELTADHVFPDFCEVITYDQRKYGSVWMQKMDDAYNYVEGAEYSLFRYNEQTASYELYRPDASYENPGVTGGEGILSFEDLIWGDYYIKETKAPRGYDLSTDEYPFTVGADSVENIITLAVKDKRSTGEIKLIKIREGGSENVDADRLDGAVFNLYRTDGTVVKENLTTDTVDGEKGVLIIDGLEWGSYYLEEIQAPAGYSLSGEKIRFSVNYLTGGIQQIIVAENPVEAKELAVTKRIPLENLEYAHGNPTFIFRVTDTTPQSWYKSVTFDAAYVAQYISDHPGTSWVEATTIFTGLDNDHYTVTEEEVIRYEFDTIINESSNAVVNLDSEHVIIDLTGLNKDGHATFVNKKTYHESTSETVQVNNIIKKMSKLTAITAEYTGGILSANTIDRNDLDVWAIYDDGVQKQFGTDLPVSDYTIYYQDGNNWIPLGTGDTLPEEELLNGEYTLRISYTENSITRTADVVIQISRPGPFRWTVSGSEATITAYKGTSTIVRFPEKVRGIWNGENYTDDGNTYTVVSITGTGTNMSNGNAVFDTTQRAIITQVVFPDTLKRIDNYAFYYCSGLTSLTLPPDLRYIAEYAFYYCTGLRGNLIIPDNVTEIGLYAFGYCRNIDGTLKLPASLNIIQNWAFGICTSLTGDIVIPDNTVEVGAAAFYECTGFNGTLTLPQGLEKIGGSAFDTCRNLKGDIIIPNSVTELGSSAFAYCSGFNGRLHISDQIKEIGQMTFIGCSSLTGDLVIPDKVRSLGLYAFRDCSGFNGTLTLPADLEIIGTSVFSDCNSLKGNLVIPPNVTEIGSSAFRDCSGFNGTLTLPAGLQRIEDNAFRSCNNLTGSLVIPDSVIEMGKEAFNRCSGFNGTLTLGNQLTSIGDSTFYDCNGFQGSLVIPNSVILIDNYAFASCSGFNGTLTIGNSVMTIGADAFSRARGFSGETRVPASVRQIGIGAFYEFGDNSTGRILFPNGSESYLPDIPYSAPSYGFY